MRKNILSIAVISILSVNAFAKADMSLVRDYMDISGTTQTIENMSSNITNTLYQTSAIYGKKPDQKKIQRLQKIFDPQKSINIVEKEISDELKNSDLKKMIAFYRSDAGKELVDATLDSLSPNAQSELLRFLADLRENPPTKLRVKAINSLIEALDMQEMIEYMYNEIFSYLNKNAPKERRLSKKKRDELMDMMSNSLQKQLFLSSLYVYRDINNDDLNKITEYLKSKTGTKEKKVIQKAVVKMITSGFKRAL